MKLRELELNNEARLKECEKDQIKFEKDKEKVIKKVKAEVKKLFKGVEMAESAIHVGKGILRAHPLIYIENGAFFSEGLSFDTVTRLMEIYNTYLK